MRQGRIYALSDCSCTQTCKTSYRSKKERNTSISSSGWKTQVTVEYDENGVPARLDAVVLSTQHDPDVLQEQIHEDVKNTF